MANTKIINTRIQLKYDSYANWSKVDVAGKGGNLVLKAGEIAIAYLGPSHTTTTPDNGSHPVLFKVGPGAFKDLPWASALAADVYEWAKKNEVKTEGDGNAVTAAAIKDGFLTFTKGETFATKTELEALRDGLEADTNTQYHFEVPTSGANAHKLVITKKDITDSAFVDYEVVDLLTTAELTQALGAYYTQFEVNDILTSYVTSEALGKAIKGYSVTDDEKYTVEIEAGDSVNLRSTMESINISAATMVNISAGDSGINLRTDTNAEGALTINNKPVATEEYVNSAVAPKLDANGWVNNGTISKSVQGTDEINEITETQLGLAYINLEHSWENDTGNPRGSRVTLDNSKVELYDLETGANISVTAGFGDSSITMVNNQSATAKYSASGISYNDNELVFPEKAGTFALMSDVNEVSERLDAFLSDDVQVDDVVDTLVEIRKYMTDDTAAFTQLSEKVSDIEDGTTKVPEAVNADTVDGKHASDFDAAGAAATAESNAKAYTGEKTEGYVVRRDDYGIPSIDIRAGNFLNLEGNLGVNITTS